VGGNEGEASWRAIETILRLTERRLAEYAANVLGLGSANVPMNLETLTLEELEDRPPDSASHAALWGDWASREEVYYRACRDIVANLDQGDRKSAMVVGANIGPWGQSSYVWFGK
jgi:hypothetical protein